MCHMRYFWFRNFRRCALASDKEDLLKQMDARAAHYGDVSRANLGISPRSAIKKTRAPSC